MSDKGAAHPRRTELEKLVRSGEIDTLIVALTDMQGRLMGKRVQGQAFLSGVIDHGAHFCTYLLGTDMEMNTPDGFELMNWDTGYGDWIARSGVGHPPGAALAGEDGPRPVGHGRPPRRRDPRLAPNHAQARRGTAARRWASAPRPAPSSSTTC